MTWSGFVLLDPEMWIHTNPRLLRLLTGSFAASMAIWPFILIRDEKMKNNPALIRHECIHLRQQKELLLLFFYIWYLAEYLFRLIQYKNHQRAYRKISFEREAYLYEADPDYLKRRKNFAFLRFLF